MEPSGVGAVEEGLPQKRRGGATQLLSKEPCWPSKEELGGKYWTQHPPVSYLLPIGQTQPEARAQGGPSMWFVETSSLEHRPEGEDGDWIWLGNSTE